MKSLKFESNLVDQVLSGEKTSTWRLFDDKDLQEGDELSLINYDTLEEFAKVTITKIREKKLGDLTKDDFVGHNTYESDEEMYRIYREYYGDKVTSESVLKMIDFELNK